MAPKSFVLGTTFPDNLEKIFTHVQAGDEVVLDLSNTTFLSPYAVCGIYLLVSQWKNDGAKITVTPPVSMDCRNYLDRVHFFGMLQEKKLALINPPIRRVSETNQADVLFELTWIGEPKSVQKILTDRLWPIFITKGFNDDLTGFVVWVIGELCDNAFVHARVPGKDPFGAFICVQSYSNPRPNIQLAVGDLGKGIRASLAESKNFSGLKDDREAMLTAMRPGVSSWTHREGQRRGNGLTDVLKIALGSSSELDIRSVSGRIWLRGGRLGRAADEGTLDGTLVGLRLFADKVDKASREEIEHALDRV